MFFGIGLANIPTGQTQQRLNFRFRAETQNNNNMKALQKRNIAAFFAVLLGIVIITSVQANSTKSTVIPFEEDYSYVDDVQAFVDDYMESLTKENGEESNKTIKIYDESGDLILEESYTEGNMSEVALVLLHQSNFLTQQGSASLYQKI